MGKCWTAMGTARRNPAASELDPPTAAMVTGGINGASAVGQTDTEYYDGSTWTEVADSKYS